MSLNHKVHLTSFIKSIYHHLFLFNHINKLNRIYDFASEIGHTTKYNGDLVCNATKGFPVLPRQVFMVWSFWKGIGLIPAYFCFGTFSIIESSGEDTSTTICTCVLYCFVLYFCIVLKALHSLWQLLLISICHIFGHTLNKKCFLWVGKLGLIHYISIFDCVYFKYIRV